VFLKIVGLVVDFVVEVFDLCRVLTYDLLIIAPEKSNSIIKVLYTYKLNIGDVAYFGETLFGYQHLLHFCTFGKRDYQRIEKCILFNRTVQTQLTKDIPL